MPNCRLKTAVIGSATDMCLKMCIRDRPYVMDMLDFNIRPMLKRLLIWKIGIDYDFSISAGKAGKYMKKYLPDDIYQRFLETYARSEKTAVWTAIFKMCELGDAVAKEVSDALCFNYNEAEAINLSLIHILTLTNMWHLHIPFKLHFSSFYVSIFTL